MELQNARQIIETLAQGIHPVTGEVMPEDSPYNAPPVIRALFAVSQALEQAPSTLASPVAAPNPAAVAAAATGTAPKATRARTPPPLNAGKPWSEQDDAVLTSGFDRGDDLATLASALGRTRFGIEQRLVKLGKIVVPGGGRFGTPSSPPARA